MEARPADLAPLMSRCPYVIDLEAIEYCNKQMIGIQTFTNQYSCAVVVVVVVVVALVVAVVTCTIV